MTVETEPHFAVAEGGEYVLVSVMVYYWHRKMLRVKIPQGFRTDFASVPRIVQPLIPVNGRHRLPAVLHDYLYSQAGKVSNDRGGFVTYSRKDADKVFAEAMKKENVTAWKRWSMYRAVRLFGGRHLKASGIDWKS